MDKKKKPITFTLLQITTEQFAFLSDPPKTDENINILTTSRFGYNNQTPVVGVFVQFKFDSSGVPFLLIEVGCHFQIKESDWDTFIDKENSTLILPKAFAQHLLMITVGTVRGILYAKTENTSFNKFIVPLLNLSNIVNSDITLTNIQDDSL